MSSNLDTEIQKGLYDVIKPYQYIGDEYLIKKNEIPENAVTVVFSFPDKYEIGISNLGVRILYDIVNSEPDLYADRAYAPEQDFIKVLEDNNKYLYGVETKKLNQAVKRNIKRFPDDFMFVLNKDEKNELVTNCDRFKTLKHSTVMPFAFTEQGVAML